MSDIVNEFFHKHYPADYKTAWVMRSLARCYGREYVGADRDKRIFPEMVCCDGLRLSVQGHFGGYSHPRDDFADEYTAVEIMGSRRADALLAEYERDCNAVGDDQMIYPYVPVAVIAAVIEKHGGLFTEVES
jgi:hypothetical protein